MAAPTLNNLFYKPNKTVHGLFGKSVIICNKAGFSKSVAYFQAVVGGANATKNRQAAFASGLPVVGVTMFSGAIGIYRIDRHHRHYRHDYNESDKMKVDTMVFAACGRHSDSKYSRSDAGDDDDAVWEIPPAPISKSASQASSASLSSRKSSAGVWGTPQKCACG